MTTSGSRQGAAPRSLRIGGRLSVADALRGGDDPCRLRLVPGAAGRIDAAAKRIRKAVSDGEWIYGVTTGFGSNAVNQIAETDAPDLQRNLLISHAFGQGPALPDNVVRLALLLRIHALSQGHSGMRRTTLRALIRIYEADILAIVPSRGSVGASGDLAPLAHLALPLIGEGRVRVAGREMTARTALKKAGLSPTTLSYKEGLALINGMQITLALGLRALQRADTLLLTADAAAALTMEALAGRSAAIDARIQDVRLHPGQKASAVRIRKVIHGSRLVDARVEDIPGKRKAPQDAYGIRCAPQVHGAAGDGIEYARDVYTREVDAVTDNPLVFGDDILSGGNFHGEAVALASDHLRLCTHELGSISERRTASLVDPHMNEGLPAYLAPPGGLQSGYMIPQYVAAALASESKGLCVPASADSIPTGANIEDHVSMAPIGARRALEVADLVTSILAIELMTSCQALDLRARTLKGMKPSKLTRAVLAAVRTAVPFRQQDRLWQGALEGVRDLVRDCTIARAAGLLPARRAR